MSTRSAGGRSPLIFHGSMYRTSKSPFQRKPDCWYQVKFSSTLRPPLHGVPQHADALDLDLDGVTDLHELRRLSGEAHALGCSGDHDVARLELGPRGQLADQARHLEHHELRVRVLLVDTVDPGLDAQRRWIELIGGDDPWTERQVAVEVLSFEPLPTVPTLHIADRDVVRAGVPKDVRHGGVLGDVAAPATDDDRQLDLPVELLRMGRGEPDRRIR